MDIFPSKLTKTHIVTKRNEINLLKNLDVVVMKM